MGFVWLAARQLQPHRKVLTGANLMTLSRTGCAALLAGTAAVPTVGRRVGWFAFLWGGVSDWLDGPLARRGRPTRLRALLDMEADSWLTLWAAIAAYRTRVLPALSLLPPLLRYSIPILQGYRCAARPVDRLWQRLAAGLQTIALVSALAPWVRARRLARRMAPVGAVAQTVAMAFTLSRLVGQPRHPGGVTDAASTALCT